MSLTGDELLDRWKRAEMGPHPLAGRCEEQPAGRHNESCAWGTSVVMGKVGEAGSCRRPASHFRDWSVLQTEEAMQGGVGVTASGTLKGSAFQRAPCLPGDAAMAPGAHAGSSR